MYFYFGARSCLCRVSSVLMAGVLAVGMTGMNGQSLAQTNPASAQVKSANDVLDARQREQILTTLANKLTANYVFEDVAAKMVADVRARQQRGEYAKLTTLTAFGEALTRDLRAISKDKHISVRFAENPVPEDVPAAEQATYRPSAEERQRAYEQARSLNFGIAKYERLQGNIGLLELNGFVNVEHSGEALTAVMNLAANSDALIIDLRKNGGGDPGAVAWLSSYLFDITPVHLNDLYYRFGSQTLQFWTLQHVPGKRFGQDKPVFVLTSSKTFSAAEEFSYNLQNLRRATLIGETTGGGANPGGVFKLGEHLSMFIPTGRAINPVTKTNWEGVGVKPEVAIASDLALLKAQVMAIQALLEKPMPPRRKEAMQKALSEWQAKLAEGLKGK